MVIRGAEMKRLLILILCSSAWAKPYYLHYDIDLDPPNRRLVTLIIIQPEEAEEGDLMPLSHTPSEMTEKRAQLLYLQKDWETQELLKIIFKGIISGEENQGMGADKASLLYQELEKVKEGRGLVVALTEYQNPEVILSALWVNQKENGQYSWERRLVPQGMSPASNSISPVRP
jgi:hypothetical protein